VQATAFALVLETVRWRGLKSSPARNGGVGGALSRSAIVTESLAPGAVVTEIARRAEICPGQIYRWRQEIGVGHGFAQVLIAPVGDGAGCPAPPAIEIEFAGKARVRIPASIPTGLAAAVVKALSGR
jgi:transposase